MITGSKVIGEVVIRDKDNKFVISFSSEDAETKIGRKFEEARIQYVMSNRDKKIPQFIRAGKCPSIIKAMLIPILKRR